MSEGAEFARLRWRCRRGTRELDALFGWWLGACYATASEAGQRAFAELLDAQDPDLWDWVMGRTQAPREDWRAIIDAIRAQHRL